VTLALDDDALEDLRAATRALDDLEVDANAVAGLEVGLRAELFTLELLDYGGHQRGARTGRKTRTSA
jgi:hypothetical protein